MFLKEFKTYNLEQTTAKQLQILEANVSSSHTIAQFVLVPKERHSPHIGLDVDLLVQHQNTIGLPRNRLHNVDFLRCILQPLTKVLKLWTNEEET